MLAFLMVLLGHIVIVDLKSIQKEDAGSNLCFFKIVISQTELQCLKKIN